MKITIYTITECQYSTQEKDYLKAHNLQFEEKNLEANRDFLTEMMAVSNNFAGTPVTKIEKDDGQIIILKGFTQDEFDKALGFVPVTKPIPTPEKPIEEISSSPVPPSPVVPTPPQPDKITSPSIPPMPQTAPNTIPSPLPPIETPPVTVQPIAPPQAPVTQAQSAVQPDDHLNSILNNLQQKAAEPIAPTPTQPPVVANVPNIPDFT